MTITIGTQLGSYEITSLLGKGGMGEVFWVGLDERLMAVSIRFAANAQTVEPAAPVPLFPTHVGGAVQQGGNRQQYIVSPDGQRFLMNTITGGGDTSPVTVILNWKAKP